jgi:hypothetical protein
VLVHHFSNVRQKVVGFGLDCKNRYLVLKYTCSTFWGGSGCVCLHISVYFFLMHIMTMHVKFRQMHCNESGSKNLVPWRDSNPGSSVLGADPLDRFGLISAFNSQAENKLNIYVVSWDRVPAEGSFFLKREKSSPEIWSAGRLSNFAGFG